MSNFKPKSNTADNSIKIVNTNILRPAQFKHLLQDVLDGITDSYAMNDPRILISQGPTGSGKSWVLVNVSIPAMIQRYPNCNSIVFMSPDSGCVDAPYQKFYKMWHNKVIINRLGQRVRIRVLNKDELNKDLKDDEREFHSVEPVVEVVFATAQYVGMKWGDYIPQNTSGHNLLPPSIIIVDEIHYGMGTSSWRTMMEDQGRTNKKYKPHWLTVLRELAKHGSKVIGFTGTPTKSQLGQTTEGQQVFNQLSVMPKEKDNTAFVNGWSSADPVTVFRNSKNRIEQDLVKLNDLFVKISDDTWTKASEIGIDKKMPGAMFKFGRKNACNGLDHALYNNLFKSWGKGIGADVGVVTCNQKSYTNKKPAYSKLTRAINIIDEANDKANYFSPVLISVIQQGNMGWDIPRLKYIAILTRPTGKNVTIMQEQLMARANRLPFENMHSHTVKANEIASLSITTEQKKLLAEYVVFMCSAVIFIPEGSELLMTAFHKFAMNTHNSDEGMKIYMDAIDNFVPKQNVTKFSAPRVTEGYNAGSKNQTYKKYHCEACMNAGWIDASTGKTMCEVGARKVREFERGSVITDNEWPDIWFHTLALDHLNGDRTDYSPSNLLTRCPTNNGAKTYDAKDYLNKYDSNGKKANGA